MLQRKTQNIISKIETLKQENNSNPFIIKKCQLPIGKAFNANVQKGQNQEHASNKDPNYLKYLATSQCPLGAEPVLIGVRGGDVRIRRDAPAISAVR